jgi:hypothetical protein
VAVVATLSKGYDLDSIRTQVDRDPAKVPGQLLPSGRRERRGAAGPLVGPGRKDPWLRLQAGGLSVNMIEKQAT